MNVTLRKASGAFAVLAVCSWMGAGRLAAAEAPIGDLDSYVEEVRTEWRVVGMSVAVVKDGRLVYAKGFGVRELAKSGAVDEDTLFAIGSNSKAFTAAGLGMLVDEKRLGWDDKVTKHLPWFELYDPYVTREITVRDLLSHRSGLGRRGDLNWYGTDFTREDVVRRVRHLEPNSSFRSQAGYQNTMFLTAGLVNEAIAGVTWDEWIKARIFDPLGMVRSRTKVEELEAMDNVARPHHIFDGVRTAIPYRNLENVAPAGAILSSASEMSRWLRMMLARGEFEGQRILSESVVKEIWTPNVIYSLGAEAEKLFPMSHISTYGLGWGLRDYRGRLLASHSGGIDGMLSRVAVLPEEKLGVVILTNTTPDGGAAHDSIVYHVIDAYLQPDEPTDWRSATCRTGITTLSKSSSATAIWAFEDWEEFDRAEKEEEKPD